MALPPVPALPDTERRTSYNVTTTTTGPFDVGFDIYADGSDFLNWVEVWVDDLKVIAGWTLSSPSGPLANLARPITNARITFDVALVGTVPDPRSVKIVGARRPRRALQFGNSPTPRDLNRFMTDVIATQREIFDRLRRTIQGVPGDDWPAMLKATLRANRLVGFDGAGLPVLKDPSGLPPIGLPNGVATLDAGGLVPASQIPPLAIGEVFTVASQAAMLALVAQRGDVAIRTDVNKSFILSTDAPGTLADWKELTNLVTSVAGLQGVISAAGLKTALAIVAADITDSGATGRSILQAATAAVATAILNAFTGDAGAGGLKGLVPAPAAGDAAAQKVLLASGGWGAAPAATSSRFRFYYVANDGATWNKPSGLLGVRVWAIGPGGGAGAAHVNSNSGAGGGGGGWSFKQILAASLGATETVAVGTGGAGGAAGTNPGSAGNKASTFGAHLSAGAGAGGVASGGGAGIAAGGAATGGDINLDGAAGDDAETTAASSSLGFGGGCGQGAIAGRTSFNYTAGTFLGIGRLSCGMPWAGQGAAPAFTANTAGNNGLLFGGGGSGGWRNGANQAGGNGANGLVVVEEIFGGALP